MKTSKKEIVSLFEEFGFDSLEDLRLRLLGDSKRIDELEAQAPDEYNLAVLVRLLTQHGKHFSEDELETVCGILKLPTIYWGGVGADK